MMQEDRSSNILRSLTLAIVMGLAVFSFSRIDLLHAAEKPQPGGILTFAVADAPPSYDAHKESTFSVIHSISPFYSLLLKFDPDNYPQIVGDVAESWSISKDHKTYTFKIRREVEFHDGSILTARDVKASYDKIIFPVPGIISTRKSFYDVVDKIEAPDNDTVIFQLKHPSASFLGSLASPWNYLYKADILAKDPRWYEKNIMGTGPFKFVEYVSGSHLVGKRHERYFVKGRPYLDGYRAVYIKDTGARVAAVRSGRVLAEFRFFGPTHRDEVVAALGNKIRVHEGPIATANMVIFHTEKKPFNDPRVRRALSLAIDRWEGSKILSRIANLKEVGGLLRPGSKFSVSEEELTKWTGYSRDIEASRKEARRLLREAGVPEGFSFVLKNRPPAKDYETIAVWLIDQWRQIGLNVTQKVQEPGAFFNDLRSGNFEVTINSISDYMDEPDLQFIGFLSYDKSERNYGRYTDRLLDDLYEKQSRAMDPVERKKLCTQFQTRVLDEMAYVIPVPWIHRIVLYSPKMKGWKGLPSHFLNQDLRDVWLGTE
jgi:peptide/nickel transport system substrate-binding protein